MGAAALGLWPIKCTRCGDQTTLVTMDQDWKKTPRGDVEHKCKHIDLDDPLWKAWAPAAFQKIDKGEA